MAGGPPGPPASIGPSEGIAMLPKRLATPSLEAAYDQLAEARDATPPYRRVRPRPSWRSPWRTCSTTWRNSPRRWRRRGAISADGRPRSRPGCVGSPAGGPQGRSPAPRGPHIPCRPQVPRRPPRGERRPADDQRAAQQQPSSDHLAQHQRRDEDTGYRNDHEGDRGGSRRQAARKLDDAACPRGATTNPLNAASGQAAGGMPPAAPA